MVEKIREVHKVSQKDNTLYADINELCVGKFIGGSWDKFNSDVAPIFLDRFSKAKSPQLVIAKAKHMAHKVIEWYGAAGYSEPQEIFWTARHHTLNIRNPSDLLIRFADGRKLGVSTKTSIDTQNRGIAFKNFGLGTIDTVLDTQMYPMYNMILSQYIDTLALPKQQKERSKIIDSSLLLTAYTERLGDAVLSDLRDNLYDALCSYGEAREHYLYDWLECDGDGIPYIIITGYGNTTENITSVLIDPANHPTVNMLKFGVITHHKLGRHTIGIMADNTPVFKIRLKFESRKLTSSIKLTGEPW